VIALCCEYSEWDIDECLKEYDLETIDQLRDRTTVIEVEGLADTIIIQDF